MFSYWCKTIIKFVALGMRVGCFIFFPTCQVRVVRFYQNVVPSSSFLLPSSFFLLLAGHHLPARECSESHRTSSAASLDCICRLPIAIKLVRLLQCDQICGPRRTGTSRESLLASPDCSGSKVSWASPDFLRLEERCGPRRTFCAR